MNLRSTSAHRNLEADQRQSDAMASHDAGAGRRCSGGDQGEMVPRQLLEDATVCMCVFVLPSAESSVQLGVRPRCAWQKPRVWLVVDQNESSRGLRTCQKCAIKAGVTYATPVSLNPRESACRLVWSGSSRSWTRPMRLIRRRWRQRSSPCSGSSARKCSF